MYESNIFIPNGGNCDSNGKMLERFFCFTFGHYLEHDSPRKHGGREERHAHPGYGGRRGVVNVVRFETQFGIGRHNDPIAVGQRQRLVVVQHGVQVLYPYRVHWAVQNDPAVFVRGQLRR